MKKLGHSNESLNLPIVEEFKVVTEISSNIRNYVKRIINLKIKYETFRREQEQILPSNLIKE